MFKNFAPAFVDPVENCGDKISIVHLVAHYSSPQKNATSSSEDDVAELMEKFGMNVTLICGEELAEMGGVGELGLILEHEIDSESDEFEKLVDAIKLFLHQLGWSYHGWVSDDVEVVILDHKFGLNVFYKKWSSRSAFFYEERICVMMTMGQKRA